MVQLGLNGRADQSKQSVKICQQFFEFRCEPRRDLAATAHDAYDCMHQFIAVNNIDKLIVVRMKGVQKQQNDWNQVQYDARKACKHVCLQSIVAKPCLLHFDGRLHNTAKSLSWDLV